MLERVPGRLGRELQIADVAFQNFRFFEAAINALDLFAFFGFTLAGDRLGALGWSGCVVIMAGIVVAEPAAASVLAGVLRRSE